MASPRALPLTQLERRQEKLGWIFVAPTLVALCLVGLYPMLQTCWASLTDARMASGRPVHFVGLSNYGEILTRRTFWDAAGNTLTFAAVGVSLEMLFGVSIALALNMKFRGRGLLRAAILIPWALPTVVSARMWNYMLADGYGVVNDLLVNRLHLLNHGIAWTAEPGYALASAIAVDVWKTTPFVVLLVLAGLQLIPGDVYEAAAVDGASPWRRFRSVTLPLLMPTLLVVLLLRTLDALRVFDAIWVLTRGQLGTESLATYVYRQTVDFRKTGFGAAVSVTIFVVLSLIVVAYLMLLARPERDDDAIGRKPRRDEATA